MIEPPTPQIDPAAELGVRTSCHRRTPRGRRYRPETLRKWVRALHDFHKAEKADLWTRAADAPLLGMVFEEITAQDMPLGLCIDAREPESLLNAAPRRAGAA
jgi:hypothetical protein